MFTTWSRPTSVGSRPWATSWACVFLYPYTAMKKSECIVMMAARQSLVARGHAAHGPGPEHAAAARREEPAIQRLGEDPAYRPDPETVLEFVDVRDFQRRAGSSLAAKKADAVVRISFARRSSATSALSFLSSAIASSADCLVSAATVASASLRQRRSDSGAIPGSLATCSIALVSDEYEDRDSVSSLTAFALNSGVYLVPFALVPSSPNQSEEMRNKNSPYHRPVRVRRGHRGPARRRRHDRGVARGIQALHAPAPAIHGRQPVQHERCISSN